MRTGSSLSTRKSIPSSQLVSAFLQGRDDWFICESMKQHRYSDQIYDKTVNTIRMITLRDVHTHQFKIFFAVQRIGTEATIPVDNGSQGRAGGQDRSGYGGSERSQMPAQPKRIQGPSGFKGAPIEGAQIPGLG